MIINYGISRTSYFQSNPHCFTTCIVLSIDLCLCSLFTLPHPQPTWLGLTQIREMLLNNAEHAFPKKIHELRARVYTLFFFLIGFHGVPKHKTSFHHPAPSPDRKKRGEAKNVPSCWISSQSSQRIM